MNLAILMPLSCPWARQVARHMVEFGHTVHLIEFRGARSFGSYLFARDDFQAQSIAALREMVAGVHLLDSRLKSGVRYFTCAGQLRRICGENHVDVAISLYGGGWATMLWLSKVRPYAVYTVGSDILRANRVNRCFSRRTLAAAEVVFANGAYLAQRTRDVAPQAQVVPLVMGVDTSRFTPGKGAGKPVQVLCTRGFLPVYNNEYLIQGLAAMSSPGADFRVTFSSSGPGLAAAQAMAAATLPPALRPQVEFLGGVTDDALLANLQSAQVFVSLSRSDGTAISLLEALSCGLFPILSDIPQNREWVDPAFQNGLLVPLDQPQALADALRRAVCDEPMRVKAAKINRQLAMDRADVRKNMTTLAAKLQEIAPERMCQP